MKHSGSPLVWLCVAGSVALTALALADPADVYTDYVAALEPNTPPIAAVFTAAQDGVYPWTAFTAPDSGASAATVYQPLTETVTGEEMHSSVGSEEPFASAAAEDRTAADKSTELTPSVEIIRPEETETPETEKSSNAAFVRVDESWFSDALFIGDSHTEGLCDYGKVSGATFYFKRGVDVWSVMNKAFLSGKQTIPQALASRHFGKIYILLGINEIGVGTTESFAAQYGKVVAQLRELQPDALIYIQSIFHTSQKKSASSPYNNDSINARNQAISALADGEHVFFINCNEVFDDENGAMTPSYTGDGVHLMAPYYSMWRDYLLNFGRTGVETIEDTGSAPVIADPEPASTPTVPEAETAAPEPEAEPEPVPAAEEPPVSAQEIPAAQPENPNTEGSEPQPQSPSAAEEPAAETTEEPPAPQPEEVPAAESVPTPESAPAPDSGADAESAPVAEA